MEREAAQRAPSRSGTGYVSAGLAGYAGPGCFSPDEEELDASAEPTRSKLLALLDQLAILDVEDAEVSQLARLHVENGVIPAAETLDARHAAYATVARADIIGSPNLKRLANAWAEPRLNAMNARSGFPTVLSGAPEQVVHYED